MVLAHLRGRRSATVAVSRAGGRDCEPSGAMGPFLTHVPSKLHLLYWQLPTGGPP